MGDVPRPLKVKRKSVKTLRLRRSRMYSRALFVRLNLIPSVKVVKKLKSAKFCFEMGRDCGVMRNEVVREKR